MNIKQRIILIAGAIGMLHSSMVPPVMQGGGATCRYHEFVERSLFFTREYGVNNGDMVALVSEFGIVAAIASILFLLAGLMDRNSEK